MKLYPPFFRLGLPFFLMLSAGRLSANLHPHEYTLEMTEAEVLELADHPFVSPSPFAQQRNPGATGLEAFVIGVTPGTAEGGYTWNGNDVPQQNIYGLRIADDSQPGPKVKIVIQGGNHSDESHSNHVNAEKVRFLLSDDPLAAAFRQVAEVYYYPQINPEGRWAYRGTTTNKSAGNPEHPGTDNNRHWHEPEVAMGANNRPWSHILIVQEAQRFDAGTEGVEYFFDMHAPGTTGRTQNKFFDYAQAPDRRLEWINALNEDLPSWSYTTRNTIFNRARGYGYRDPAEGGLGAAFSYTNEIGDMDEIAGYHAYGELLARAMAKQLTESQPYYQGSGRFLIDFKFGSINPVQGWNRFNSTHSGTSQPLVDDQGRETGVRIFIPSGAATSNGSGNGGWNESNPRPDWLTQEAGFDYLILYGHQYYEMDHFDVTGLMPGQTYDIEVVSARNFNRSFTVSLGDFVLPLEGGDFPLVLSGHERANNPHVIDWNDQTNGYQNGETLLFENVAANAAGRIRIKATGLDQTWGVNAIRIVARDWITGPPAFVQAPAPQEAFFGDSVTFVVYAHGDDPITYQWERQTQAGSWETIPCAEDRTLVLADVQESDVGSYRVVATNDAGSTPSAPASLTLSNPPILPVITRLQPLTSPAYVYADDGLLLETAVTEINGTTGDLSLLWEQVGGPGTTVIAQEHEPVAAVSFSEPGLYEFRLTADNGEGTDTETFLVQVLDPATGTVGPEDFTVQKIGDTSAWPGLEDWDYAWREGGAELELSAPKGNIWQTSDIFTFAWVPLVGDGVMTAQVLSFDAGNDWAKSGVMIRESLDSQSETYLSTITAGKRFTHYYRTSASSNLDRPNPRQVDPEYWVRIERAGNQIRSYHSEDGLEWNLFDTRQHNLSAEVYIGVVSSSHETGINAPEDLGVAVYRNISFGLQPPVGERIGAQVVIDPVAEVNTGEAVSLSGSAEDPTLPPGDSLTLQWQLVSGPGTVSFTDPGEAATHATFSAPGTYHLRLTADQGTMRTFAEVTVEVVGDAAVPTLESWLETHYGTDHGLDPDEDTVTKAGREVTLREAFLLGEDPENAGDVLEVVMPEATGILEFNALAGRLYFVESSEDLVHWTPLPGWESGQAGEGATISVPLPGTWTSLIFYRIRVDFP